MMILRSSEFGGSRPESRLHVSPWNREFRRMPKWRRRRDSNPRYGKSPYGGLANRWFQPLTHVSVKRLRSGGLYRRLSRPSTALDLFRNDLNAHGQAHRLAGLKHAHAKRGPLDLGRIERGIG